MGGDSAYVALLPSGFEIVLDDLVIVLCRIQRMVGWVVRGGWISFDCCILKNVSTVNFDCKLDLKAIALQARNAEYSPKVQVF
ncbi:putative TBP domain superfamily protein [Helianthus annuus]|nr:putative TBP domain superfamily protein [Helianthus annuus]